MNVPGGRVTQISPMLAVADMDATLDFYVRVLGFEVQLRSPAYSIVGRDGATIHFKKAANDAVLTAVRGHTEIYLEVTDLAALWDRVRPFKEDYIGDPNGCLVFVGQKR